jgi:membrane glycosyltransferase
MARVMQRHPRLGILQSLVVGLPSQSAFARLFQFGMRHGMRSYTMGAAWWAGDCGPYWGHNGIIRVKPFRDECDLPLLPGKPPLGGHILSHDQIEAVFMRRAGYEVRVDPHEGGSWEENPPTLPDFSGRDLRWCQGNMQYWKLMRLPDILPMSRFQLVWAILLYLSTPAFMIFTLGFAGQAAFGDGFDHAPAGLSAGLFAAFLVTALAPKLAGLLDVALTKGGIARYGGALRFTLGALAEITFYQLLYAITSFRVSVFMAGLLFGKSIRWNGQARDARGLTWGVAWSNVWPQTLAGIAIFAALAHGAPATIPCALVWAGGLLFAAPFAVLTASPRVSAWFVRTRFCGIPEEFDTPPEVAALARPTSSGKDLPCAA